MAQTLRPAATTVSTRIASGDHTAIDEPSANDSSYIETQTLSSGNPATYECRLDVPPRGAPSLNGTPTATVEWRGFETVDGVSCTVSLLNGSTLLDSLSPQSLPSVGFQEFSGVFDLSGVFDWTDLRLRFHFQTLSGSKVARLSWAQLRFVPEPDANMMMMFEDS